MSAGEPSVGDGGERRTGDRLSSLLAASAWIVVLVEDFVGFREWERLDNQLRNKLAEPAVLRPQMRELWERVHVEILPVIAWAVRARAGESDEIVPIVPAKMRIGPFDEVMPDRTMIRIASMSFLDEDERRMLSRDSSLRRKLEWYAEKLNV